MEFGICLRFHLKPPPPYDAVGFMMMVLLRVIDYYRIWRTWCIV